MILEPLQPYHADEMFVPLQDVQLYRYIPQEPPDSIESLRERYERLALGRSSDGEEIWLNWAARERRSRALVGTFQATVYANQSADIAYIIFATAQRHGYAAEGCAGVLRHLERDLAVRVAGADIDTRNGASIALIERLGFSRIRTTQDADFFKGATSDEYRYERVLQSRD